MKEQENLKLMKEKSKNLEPEEQKKQFSRKSSFTNSHLSPSQPLPTTSYDNRKPSILEDNTLSSALLNKKISVAQATPNENRPKSQDEMFCDNSCTGAFFSYHKVDKPLMK